jgi:RNA polymerase sigma factor (TIGR02999 family)
VNELSDENISPATLTRLLNEASAGDAQSSAQLLPLVYQQLRALAAKKMQGERSDHTLQGTALVHEAYLRLVDVTGAQHWEGRWHFFAAAAEAMRRILVDKARHRSRLRRGGDRQRLSLDDLEVTVEDPPEDLLALDEALDTLAVEYPQHAQLVKLRYFAGLSMQEAADALGISVRTAGRDWAYARAWLYEYIRGDP